MISVTWEALLPLLIDSAAAGHADAREELERLARAMDGWNQRAPSILAALEGAIGLLTRFYESPSLAHSNALVLIDRELPILREALALVRGGMK
jgi:hypothetical protein